MKANDKKYRVWFHQINQGYIDIIAPSKGFAMEKAMKEWRRNNVPTISEVSEVADES